MANPDEASTDKTMTSRPLSSGGAFKTAEQRMAETRGIMVHDDDGLFDMVAPPPVSLRDRFGVPPFSILDRRSGEWQDRRRRWLSFGIRSELGRDGGLIASEDTGYVQSGIPMEKRSDRALQASAKGSSAEAARARRILEERQANGRNVLDGAPPPGGGGTGAWRGRSASGAMKAIDPKWDDKGERQRFRGALEGGTQRAMEGRDHGSGFSSAERNAERDRLNAAGAHRDQDKLNEITGQETLTGTSIFDPVLCELAYRWFTAPGHVVLDPFAGGSVRGIVAGLLERRYLGIDLRSEQIEANREQAKAILPGSPWAPRWKAGDSCELLDSVPPNSVDFMWSCPPYADLEVYSDDPKDLSTMSYEEFLAAHALIIERACRALRPNRFAAWVISDIRDKKGYYRGLGAATVEAFKRAGLQHYNEGIILDPVGSAAVRAGRIFNGGRKLTRMHQYLHVFVKGDFKKATLALGESEQQRGAGE